MSSKTWQILNKSENSDNNIGLHSSIGNKCHVKKTNAPNTVQAALEEAEHEQWKYQQITKVI